MSLNDSLLTIVIIAFIIGGIYIAYVLWQAKNETAEEEARFAKMVRNWEQRAKELNIDVTKPLIYRKFEDSDDFYPMHFWREGSFLVIFEAKPGTSSHWTTYSEYPENIRIERCIPLRCYRTGEQGTRREYDYTAAMYKQHQADKASGFKKLVLTKEANDAAWAATSHTVKYDTRRTIVESSVGDAIFRIDAYEKIIALFPELK